jgi:hypothetical protein
MNNALSEEQREGIRKMARESATRDSPLSNFDRDIIGNPSVRVNVPLRDTVELRVHLDCLANAVERARAVLSYQGKDQRAAILTVRGLLRQAHKKMNVYRVMRRD